MVWWLLLAVRHLLTLSECKKWSRPLKNTIVNGQYRRAYRGFKEFYCTNSTLPHRACAREAQREWTDLPLDILLENGPSEFCEMISDDASTNVDPRHHQCNWCKSGVLLFDRWMSRMTKEQWASEVSDYCHVSAKYFGPELCKRVAAKYSEGRNKDGTMCESEGFCDGISL